MDQDEEAAALLAELKAISNRSAASKRFGEEIDDSTNGQRTASEPAETRQPQQLEQDLSFVSAKSSSSTDRFDDAKSGDSPRKLAVSEDSGAVPKMQEVTPSRNEEPDPTKFHEQVTKLQTYSTKATVPLKFQGDRGGAAEDTELLAEPRVISTKSSVVNRFADDANDNVAETCAPSSSKLELALKTETAPGPSQSPVASYAKASEFPPWRRGKTKQNVVVDVVVTTPPVPPAETEPAKVDEHTTVVPQTVGIKSASPFSFQSDRGGTTEAEELLAELRAISAKKSSSANRFAEDVNVNFVERSAIKVSEEEVPSSSKQAIAEQVPVKADGPITQPPHSFCIKLTTPSTFQGDRGGAAEDAELLAELRAISAKSSSASRFADEANGTVRATSATSVLDEVLPSTSKQELLDTTESAPGPSQSPAASTAKSELPPWEQSKTRPKADIDVVVAAPPAPPAEPVAVKSYEQGTERQTFGIKSTVPSKFQGDRGGAAEDAELLAELRAISAKSSSANRFADEANGAVEETSRTKAAEDVVSSTSEQTAPVMTRSASGTSKSSAASKKVADELPPWKRGKKKPSLGSNAEIVLAARSAPSAEPKPVMSDEQATQPQTFGIKSAVPSTFQGDRGGAAEDAELLAELRAISANSSSANRFADDANDTVGESRVTKEVPSSTWEQGLSAATESAPGPRQPPAASEETWEQLPPWKRGRNKLTVSANADVIVAAAPAALLEPEPVKPDEYVPEHQTFGIKSTAPSTFQGDRGGAAEDAELLAELRAISAKSSSLDRFAEGSTENDDGPWASLRTTENGSLETDTESARMPHTNTPSMVESKKANSQATSPRNPPPWKRNKSKGSGSSKTNIDVSVAAPPPVLEHADSADPGPESFGIKSSMPSTFKGDRGGAAEDAELLAELRAISAKSTSDRFAGGTDGNGGERGAFDSGEAVTAVKKSTERVPRSRLPRTAPKTSSTDIPPWKQGNAVGASSSSSGVVIDTSAPTPISSRPEDVPQHFGIKSSLPSTFSGDRGGAAEDADLLAELRAISSKSSSMDRFTIEGNGDFEEPSKSVAPPKKTTETKQPEPSTERAISHQQDTTTVTGMPPSPQATSVDAPTVTEETLPYAVTDKSWKLRKEAYVLLRRLLSNRVQAGEGNGSIDGDSLIAGLDQGIPRMVLDSHAGALDGALLFAVDYAEHCGGASSAELAGTIVSSLVNGNALSSSRPSTSKSTSALILKLMEVGGSGFDSVHSVTEVLLTQGLTSRKPKIVIAASALILEAAYDFGASSLPLAAISSSAPKMMSHSNATVRETGVKIVAEVCRALGSKSPLQGVIDNMKTAQVSQLDAMLEAQPNPTPVRVGLRSARGFSSLSPADALAALEQGEKDLEAKRLADREPVNIFKELPKTDYSTRIKLPKWSEKTAALDLVITCGGEKPYKLVQPGRAVSYAPLISEMKSLLSHTHFAVVSKSMQVLSMLAQGVGASLFSQLRPLLNQLIALSKDKKLNRAVGECLDSFYGNVLEIEHIIDTDDALPSSLNEKAEKNALVRASALQFLERCIKRGDSAGPRGGISEKAAANVAFLCCGKLDDSDAGVRKAATESLRSLLAIDDAGISAAVIPTVNSLKSKNSRVYKTLMGSSTVIEKKSSPIKTEPKRQVNSRARSGPATGTETRRGKGNRATLESTPCNESGAVDTILPTPSAGRVSTTTRQQTEHEDTSEAPNLDEAVSTISSIGIPSWDAPEDDGGVAAGLQSSKWLHRQTALLNIVTYVRTHDCSVELTASLLVIVKENTKSFKETNVNVTKAFMELFLALCDHAKTQPFPAWASKDGVTLAVDKIADKKLTTLASSLLTNMCTVRPPQGVVEYAIVCIDKVKSPLGHEAFLGWSKDFFEDFGASSIGPGINYVIPWLLKECESTSPKVRRMALSVVGDLHVQMGPAFRALLLSSCLESSSMRSQLERTLDENAFDPAAANVQRPRCCTVMQSSTGGAAASSAFLVLPKMDLAAALSSDCIRKMGSKEGKTSWKVRKEALDEVDAALGKCHGLISTESLNPLVELLRALRERLSDSQSNLKPLAARIIGSLLGSVDSTAQAKLGKIVFAPLANAVMNDNRKPMKDASMEALRTGTTTSPIEGGKPNSGALESLVTALVAELSESEYKAGGIPDLLSYLTDVAEYLPNLDSVAAARAQNLGDTFAAVMVGCLTSSKSEARSSAETLLKACVEHEKLSLSAVKKGMKRLLPAQQRTVIPVIARLPNPSPHSPSVEKENDIPSEPQKRGRKPVNTSAPTAPSRQHSSKKMDGGVEAAHVAPADSSFDSRSSEPEDSHPLVAIGEKGKKTISPSRRMNWPEHPEEPNSQGQFGALKKIWSHSLPSRSVAALFPAGGIRKQDDAKKGSNLLIKAIERERTGDEEAIVDHIDLIFMWISFSLCSRENTVGLQSLIFLLLDLFALLQEQQYTLSDAEASILLPHVFEKASISKGRFHELFCQVLAYFRSDVVLPTRSLGQIICVPLIERSHQARTRVIALHECRTCVEKIGLSGLGKRGLLVTAKALSEETLPENRAAALDLMETVLFKMDGDVQKLASICGTAYLSDKAKVMIEERWKKHATPHSSLSHPASMRVAQTRRRSQLPTARKLSDSDRRKRRTTLEYNEPAPAATTPFSRDMVAARLSSPGPQDEFPSLKLRLDDAGRQHQTATAVIESHLPTSGPFAFSFEESQYPHRHEHSKSSTEDKTTWPDTFLSSTLSSNNPDTKTYEATSEHGAAASLRARLLKLREKQNQGSSSVEPSPTVAATSPLRVSSASSELSSPLNEPSATTEETSPRREKLEGRSELSGSIYAVLRGCLEELLQVNTPVPEADPRLIACTLALKKYHAAISNQPTAAPDLSYTDFVALKRSISNNTVETVENLTSIMVYAFSCNFPENDSRIAVPLLSLALATLMALFRDPGLAHNITQDSLALLIREAGKALLDPRLAMSSHYAMASQIDESTSSQMVRAINKLAVQAATGSRRDVSIEALLALQLQLCTLGNETAADAAFNSRLSRVVTKLFAKVLKAESASANPFSSDTIDLEALLCALEDMLVATSYAPGTPNRNRQDALDTCTIMGKSLIIPLITSRGRNGVDEIRETMERLEINPYESKLAELVTACEPELEFPGEKPPQDDSLPPLPSKPPSMSLASLLSALGSASEGREKQAAVASLQRYNELHGTDELNTHLSEVSEHFRVYILELLNEPPPSQDLVRSDREAQTISMSERIRHLRSKLHATVQSVVESTSTEHMGLTERPTRSTPQLQVVTEPVEPPYTPSRSSRIPEPSSPTPSRKIVQPGTPSTLSRRTNAGEARLTPSRIPKLSSATATSRNTESTALSLRERLAAAQANRTTTETEEAEDSLGRSTSAYGHAAALRARLEAVKNKKQQDD